VLRSVVNWFTQSGFPHREGRAPVDVIVLRLFGLAWLVAFCVTTALTRPRPAFHGRGGAILGVAVLLGLAAIRTQRRAGSTPTWVRVTALLLVSAGTAALAALQPNGIWEIGPYFVAVVAALRLERLAGALTFAASLAMVVAVAAAQGNAGAAISATLGAIPWFLILRLLREMRDQHAALLAAQAAEARAAAAAERGRLAREMHDVLAHSLSALALQLESTRLLAHDRGVDGEVTRAIDRAHELAAGGLEETRRAIAALRGDELPGPERLEALTAAFGEQSGLPVSLQVRGEPRALAPDARLAIYRTTQEALTNVRRHAAAERVEVALDYADSGTALVVEDHGGPGTPPPLPPSAALAGASGGYGLSGMRERAELLGGRLCAHPTADGFRVELWLPPAAAPATVGEEPC
jgi:signal transduction histidine kinase